MCNAKALTYTLRFDRAKQNRVHRDVGNAAALTANLGSLESTVTGYPPPCDDGQLSTVAPHNAASTFPGKVFLALGPSGSARASADFDDGKCCALHELAFRAEPSLVSVNYGAAKANASKQPSPKPEFKGNRDFARCDASSWCPLIADMIGAYAFARVFSKL